MKAITHNRSSACQLPTGSRHKIVPDEGKTEGNKK
jgi:hypothetical protein